MSPIIKPCKGKMILGSPVSFNVLAKRKHGKTFSTTFLCDFRVQNTSHLLYPVYVESFVVTFSELCTYSTEIFRFNNFETIKKVILWLCFFTFLFIVLWQLRKKKEIFRP